MRVTSERVHPEGLLHYEAGPDGWAVRAAQLAPGPFECTIDQLELTGVGVFIEHHRTPLCFSGTPGPRYVIAGHMPGARPSDWRGGDTSQGFTLCTPGAEQEAILSDHLWELIFEPAVLEGYADALGVDLARATGWHLLPVTPARMNAYARCIERTLTNCRDEPVDADRLRDALVGGLLGLLEPVATRPRRTPPRRRRLIVSEAMACLWSEGAPASVPDLARVLGRSQRSIEYAFRETLDMTPLQFMRALALNGAHRELTLANAADTSVSDIATGAGFEHLGRFAEYYRRLFGEPPSRTLRRRPPRRVH